MKRLIVPMMMLMSLSAHALTSKVVFECKSVLLVDTQESVNLEIKIVDESAKLVSYLVGSGEPGPIATEKQIVSLQDGLKMTGVQHILKATGLSASAIKEITTIVVYTAGNFDDDASGVRTAEFLDKTDHVLAAGMFFGWGGPSSCQ